MSALLVVNDVSGGAGDVSPEELADALSELTKIEVWSCEERSEFADRLRASAASVEHVVVAAGDGTLNLAVDALHEMRDAITFGVIPMGTGNDLARSLGLPLDPLEAARSIAAGTTREIDTGVLTSGNKRRVFVNACMGGFPVAVDEAITEEVKERLGPVAFWWGGARAAVDLDRYSVEIDGEMHDDVVALGVGNGRTAGGGIEVFPEAELDDGSLDLCIMRAEGLWDAARLAAKVRTGSHADEPYVVYRKVRSVNISATPELEFNIDGEVEGAVTPVAFEVGPAVRFLAGR